MSHKFKDINIKSHRYEFFDNIINIKHFDPNNIKINKKLYKDSKYVKINSVNPLYLIFSKVNEYFDEINKNKCSMLVPANESKKIIKKYVE